MEPPVKQCRLCRQSLPALPQLPFEIIDKIMCMLPFQQYVYVMGANALTRRKALLNPDWHLYYFELMPPNYEPAADDVFATHWNIEVDDPARPYVAELCRFSSASDAQHFFNKRMPPIVMRCMLNTPRAASDDVLARRWGWWRLVRALLNHDAANGRDYLPTRVQVSHEDDHDVWVDNDRWSDASPFEFNAQPDFIINVLFDDANNIQVYVYRNSVYRIVQ
jgi:hypothetical protein